MSLDIYKSLGIELSESGSQLIADCPFCTKRKMYVDPKKTTFNCKVCDARGNPISILGQMFDKVYRPALDARAVARVARRRGIPKELLLCDPNLGYDAVSGRLVWIVRKIDGTPVGLRRAVWNGKKYQIRNLKGTKLGLLGAENMRGVGRDVPIFMCEGEWDRASTIYLLQESNESGIVVSLPGVSNFNREWTSWFKDKKVFCLFDHDLPTDLGTYPGEEGCKKVGKAIKNYARSVRYLHYDGIDRPCDIHDLVKLNIDDLPSLYDHVIKSSELFPPGSKPNEAGEDKDEKEHEQQELEPITVEELHSIFRRWLHLDNCDLLDIVMSVLFAVDLPGDPLWMLIVSPPSASKSETLIPVSEWFRCFALSTLTAKSLCSGYSLQGGADPSLLAELNGKRSAIIVKDMTPLLEGNINERDEVFGILRDAYDGSAKKVFGNGVVRQYDDLHFAFISGVTPAIDVYDGSAMGERFLKFRADRELQRHDDDLRAMKAVLNCGQEGSLRKELTEGCLRVLAKERGDVPLPDNKFASNLVDIALYCAKMRAVAPSDRFSDIQEMHPIQEAPPRLAKQLTKLAQGAALYFGIDDLNDDRIMRLIKRVALHTPGIITTRIIRALYELYDEGPASVKTVSRKCRGLSRETVRTILTKLIRTEACEQIENLEGGFSFLLNENIRRIVEDQGLFNNLPKNDPLYRGRRLALKK